jgi:hypothetical protein
LFFLGSLPNEISTHFVDAKTKKNWDQVESNPPLFRKELTKPKDRDIVMEGMSSQTFIRQHVLYLVTIKFFENYKFSLVFTQKKV